MTQHVVTIVAAVATSLITWLSTWLLLRGPRSREIEALRKQVGNAAQARKTLEANNKKVTQSLQAAEAETNRLQQKEKEFERVRDKLRHSSVVKTFHQPVVLVGPREVGKSSLLRQWHEPWEGKRPERTAGYGMKDVPIFDYAQTDLEPHFADPTISASVHKHLMLRVHDFPGEESEWRKKREIVISETRRLREETNKNLGIVLICMFDAKEAKTGITARTRDYYHGELFKQLKSLTASDVDIERLILVFNKYDVLRQHVDSNVEDDQLQSLCEEQLQPAYELLRNVCSEQKIVKLYTVLNIQEMRFKNRGAPVVKAEASRAFVRAFTGRDPETPHTDDPPDTYGGEEIP